MKSNVKNYVGLASCIIVIVYYLVMIVVLVIVPIFRDMAIAAPDDTMMAPTSTDTPEESIGYRIGFMLMTILGGFFIISIPILVFLIVALIWTAKCYFLIAVVHDDAKQQKRLRWLNILYMPFYFFRMKNKGWLPDETDTRNE